MTRKRRDRKGSVGPNCPLSSATPPAPVGMESPANEHGGDPESPHGPRACQSAVARNPWAPAEPTEVFDTYWRFAAARQELFFKKATGAPPPWTSDPILRTYKFTNAYRAADRVSQFLIREVMYGGPQGINDLFFRIILFKLLNRIETWQLLENSVGTVSWQTFSLDAYGRTLSAAMARGESIYSAAYMMPSGRSAYGGTRKHLNHLRLLESMMADGLPQQVAQARSMREAFEVIRAYPTMGDFLAYQFVTDLNYSVLTDFSEMEFVAPGPGARDGIRKCFRSLGGLNEAEIILLVAQRQTEEFSGRGIEFQTLWGRPLQLIDCQNLFCEVDKYARAAHPNVQGISGRTRIKQKYRPQGGPIEYWFPPKWGINEAVARWKEGTEILRWQRGDG